MREDFEPKIEKRMTCGGGGKNIIFQIDGLYEWFRVASTGVEAFVHILFYATYVHIFLYHLIVSLRIEHSKMSGKVGCYCTEGRGNPVDSPLLALR